MKAIHWFPNTLEELSKYPDEIKLQFGYGLRFVQNGLRPASVKTFLGAIQEIREWGADSDYRVFYVANLDDYVYVLHVMIKHSASGVAVPQKDRDLILTRYAEALDKNKGERSKKKGPKK